MSHPAAFKQADLTRALKAARAAGLTLGEVILSPNGEIRLRTKAENVPDYDRPNSLDRKYGA